MKPVDVITLSAGRAGEAIEVMCDAFFAYPVMRYVIDPGGEYQAHLRALVQLFVMARFLRGDLVLGETAPGGALAGIATVTLPGEKASSEALGKIRDGVWRRLGEEARRRYERFGAACRVFDIEREHYHLNMIGVRRVHAGLGVGRVLLDAVHVASLADERSCGVTLTTEDPANVPLYQRFGYRMVGHVEIGEVLQSWGFFREE